MEKNYFLEALNLSNKAFDCKDKNLETLGDNLSTCWKNSYFLELKWWWELHKINISDNEIKIFSPIVKSYKFLLPKQLFFQTITCIWKVLTLPLIKEMIAGNERT